MLTKEHIEEYKKLDAENKVNWHRISCQQLSEEFIREFHDKVNWEYISQYQKLSEDFIKEFQDKVSWSWISQCQKLSESFIREFHDKVNWDWISANQKLSEDFIREFQDKVIWYWISKYQKLSEDFIREFKNKVNWSYISKYQKLSEDFIREFNDKFHWYCISVYQKLSQEFVKEFKDNILIDIQLKSHHDIRTIEQKRTEMKEYAQKHKLKFENDILYAYRNHDKWGRGFWNKTIFYESGEYYRDWHCDLDPEADNSFGLGIWPKGNTPVEIKLEDWGCVCDPSSEKARVLGIKVN